MVTSLDIVWLAGYLEGEGSFGIQSNCPRICLGTTDLDVIEKVGKLWQRKWYKDTPHTNRFGTKPMFRIAVCSSDAIAWMFMIYQFLGVRRQAKIREIVVTWKKCATKPKPQLSYVSS